MTRVLMVFLSLFFVAIKQVFGQGFDFRLFENTPVADLARAVETQDTSSIVLLVNIKKRDVNYLEPKFGNSLLGLALINEKQFSVEKLLELGANPNVRSPVDSATPFLSFCRYARGNSLATPEMLSLLIKYKADVNSEQVLQKADASTKTPLIKKTALQYLCVSGSLECVQLLVENGARLDTYPKNGKESIYFDAILNPDLDIFRYLLIDKKVQIPDYIYITQKGSKDEKKFGLRYLVNKIHKLPRVKDSHYLQTEKEVLAFLKAHGQ